MDYVLETELIVYCAPTLAGMKTANLFSFFYQSRREVELELLGRYGYRDCDMEQCICQLKRRLYDYDCFPHEIGIFLGYLKANE